MKIRAAVILLLFTSLAFNAYFYFSEVKETRYIIVNHEQKSCLDSWRGLDQVSPIWGPQIFEDHFLVTINEPSGSSFEFEASSCFHNSILTNATAENLPDKVKFLKSRGAKRVYFYKSMNEDVFSIFGSSD